MTKIEEIYQKQWEQKWEGLTFQSIPDQQSHIFAAMKEYAEYYAQKCLNVAVNTAECECGGYNGSKIEPTSILNINFPPHD